MEDINVESIWNKYKNWIIAFFVVAILILLVIIIYYINKEEFHGGRGGHWRGHGRGWGGRGRGYWRGGYYGYPYQYGWGYPSDYQLSTPVYVIRDNIDLMNAKKSGNYSDLGDGIHYYYTNWCPSCQKFKSVWDSIKRLNNSNIEFYDHNITNIDSPIKEIPTLIANKNGKIQKYDGKMNYDGVSNWINNIFPKY